ncbi:MAG: hypothetical protein IJ113_06030, partial [Eggerthellaceae bacterium]|nr:hypothetical protein [Eggerthellaceae bacterium]
GDENIDEELIEHRLLSATALMRTEMNRAHIDYENPSDELRVALVDVCCSVANRLIPRDDKPHGVTQMATTAGSYSEQFTFSNTYGTPKLLPSELSLLGIGGSTGRMLHPEVNPKMRWWHDNWC